MSRQIPRQGFSLEEKLKTNAIEMVASNISNIDAVILPFEATAMPCARGSRTPPSPLHCCTITARIMSRWRPISASMRTASGLA